MKDTRQLVGKCGLCGTKVYDHNEEVTGTTKMCEECFMDAEEWGLDAEDIEWAF